MRLSTVTVTVALVASLAYGQSAAPETKPVPPVSHEGYEAEVIHVKTLTGDSFNRLANMLSVFSAQIKSDENLRTIVVYAPKDVIAQMRRVVAELDTPGSEAAIGRNIEMTLTFLRCSTKDQTAGPALPDGIEPVVKQLRSATQYKECQLWDVVPFRLQEGKEATEQMRLPLNEGRSATLNMRIYPESATRKGQNWSVRFKLLNVDFTVPVMVMVSGATPQINFQDVGIHTAGDFLEGQKTVLGKVSGPENDIAIFVVISLKVLD